MNVYEKLQNCRCELQKMNLKKSGQNKFAGYDYYELGDFLPQVNELMLKHKLTSHINFDALSANLVIVNIEKPEEVIVFESPIAEANLKGCHAVQNLGAVQTYIRRYLYTNAFEIVEHDALDGTTGKPENKPEDKPKPKELTTAEKAWNMLLKLAFVEGMTEEQCKNKAFDLLEAYTSWTDKDGKEVKGKRTFKGMSDKAINATYGKIKKEYEATFGKEETK